MKIDISYITTVQRYLPEKKKHIFNLKYEEILYINYKFILILASMKAYTA